MLIEMNFEIENANHAIHNGESYRMDSITKKWYKEPKTHYGIVPGEWFYVTVKDFNSDLNFNSDGNDEIVKIEFVEYLRITDRQTFYNREAKTAHMEDCVVLYNGEPIKANSNLFK